LHFSSSVRLFILSLYCLHDLTGEVRTLAGPSSGFADGVGYYAQFNVPAGMMLEPGSGAILLVDTGNARLRKITFQAG
jgi:hypothetical protein